MTTARSGRSMIERKAMPERHDAVVEHDEVAATVASVVAGIAPFGFHSVVLIGSWGRGTATSRPDIDVLAISPTSNGATFDRRLHGGRLVEIISKPMQLWLDHLASDRPRWVYALVEGHRVLSDDGSFAHLVDAAERRFAEFITPQVVKCELSSLLWHSQSKLEAAKVMDSRTQAFWAALVLPTLFDALLALHDRPAAPGSLRALAVANVALDPRDREMLGVACDGSPAERLCAVAELAESLRPRLGPPDLERVEW